MARIEMQQGKYELTETVQNPKPDRRQKHDWRAEVEWKKGAVFYVVEHQDTFGRGDEAPIKWCSLHRAGEYEHYALPMRRPENADDDDCFKALKLTQKLKPASEKKLGDIFDGPVSIEPHIEKHQAPHLIAIMLDKGLISFDQVVEVVSDLNNQSEEQWSVLCNKHGI